MCKMTEDVEKDQPVSELREKGGMGRGNIISKEKDEETY